MSAGKLGCIITPLQGQAVPPGAAWCADNGCFGKGYPGDDAWWKWLDSQPRYGCVFAVAPDVVGDAAATMARSLPWLAKIRAAGFPAAYVAQDGSDTTPPPWGQFDVLFLGGSTEWKLGPAAVALTAEAVARGIPVHMGRVNSRKRMRHAQQTGVTSCDGTLLTFGPDKHLPPLLRWVAELTAQPTLGAPA
jgi:hypothetical protein